MLFSFVISAGSLYTGFGITGFDCTTKSAAEALFWLQLIANSKECCNPFTKQLSGFDICIHYAQNAIFLPKQNFPDQCVTCILFFNFHISDSFCHLILFSFIYLLLYNKTSRGENVGIILYLKTKLRGLVCVRQYTLLNKYITNIHILLNINNESALTTIILNNANHKMQCITDTYTINNWTL